LNELTKASVLVSSDEEEAESSDKTESVPTKESSRRPEEKAKSGGAAENARRPGRPALLAMKLTESETSEDDVRNR
jgi:hypothetical protein